MQTIGNYYVVKLLGMLPMNPFSHNMALLEDEWTCIVIPYILKSNMHPNLISTQVLAIS
jgi:hypothetical protein